jgi:type IV secretory pathway VirB4 component
LKRIHESDVEMAWACDWLAGLLEVQDVKLKPEELQAIAIAVGDLKSQPSLSRLPPDC